MAVIAQTPATLDIVAVKGDDLTVTLSVTESSVAYDWTGATVATAILDSTGATVATNFTTATPANGTLTMSLTDTNTTTLGVGSYRYWLSVTKSSATRTWLAGAFTVMEAGWGGTSSSSASLSITTGATTVAISNIATVASSVSLVDAANYYAAANVETAFAEIPASIGVWVPAATGIAATDTANVQAALTNNAGKCVRLPSGTWNVTGGLTIPANTTLQGLGRGSIIRLNNSANTNVFDITTDYVTIQNLSVDGNRTNQTANSNCIKTVGAETKIVDCYVTSANGYNIVGFNGASKMMVQRCISRDARDEGIEFMGVSGGTIAHNIVLNAGKNGIYVWANTPAGASNTCQNVVVSGNYVTGSSSLASNYAHIRIDDRADQVAITGNVITGGGTGCIGINVSSSTSYDVTNVTITANSITGTPGAGINLGRSIGTTVSANAISSSSGDGIYAANNTVKAVSIIGNTVSTCSLSGIKLFDLSNFVVANNVCRNNGQSGTSFSTNGIVLWNTSATPDQGVITGNRCYDDQVTKTQQYGIRTLNTIGSSVTISNNIVNGNGTDGLTFSFPGATGPSASPWKRLVNQSVASTGTTIAHGLPYTPTAIVISMTSAGNVYRSATTDATNIYLSSDSGTRTCDIYVG